ncbi:PaaI family thioesterase [soil metagenome]
MSQAEFASRFSPEIADALLNATDAAGGLPGLLGIEHVRFEPGRFFCTATIDESLLTPFGNAHGGVTAAIADHVTGVVVYPLMESGQWAATTEVKVNYLAPIKAETIDAEATFVAMTKRSAVVRCELYRQHDRRVLAAAQATLTIVDPR